MDAQEKDPDTLAEMVMEFEVHPHHEKEQVCRAYRLHAVIHGKSIPPECSEPLVYVVALLVARKRELHRHNI